MLKNKVLDRTANDTGPHCLPLCSKIDNVDKTVAITNIYSKPFHFRFFFLLYQLFCVFFPDAVKCTRLAIKQCQNAGYSFTSVSDAYQQIVESSAIFQDSDANSTLRKIICMEIAPPCDAKNNQTLNVPCRSMCDDAFNESQSEFLKVFKAQKYCSTFPESPKNSTGDGRQYCILQDWPVNGYWPSGLWAYLATAGM